MKPGLVVAIRVNPKDCQSVLAMMDASGLPRVNQSFASMVSMVLSGLLQGVRSDGIIDEPDPFMYWDQMGQYHKGSQGAGRIAVAETVKGKVKTVGKPTRKLTEEGSAGRFSTRTNDSGAKAGRFAIEGTADKARTCKRQLVYGRSSGV